MGPTATRLQCGYPGLSRPRPEVAANAAARCEGSARGYLEGLLLCGRRRRAKQMSLVRTADHSDEPGDYGLGGENAVVGFHGQPSPSWKGLPERRGTDFVLWTGVRG